MAGAVFSTLFTIIKVSNVSKVCNRRQIRAWEARKHCACAQIRAYEMCLFLDLPGCRFGVLFVTFWDPVGHLGISVGILLDTLG